MRFRSLLALLLAAVSGLTAPAQDDGRVLCEVPFHDSKQMVFAGGISADGRMLVQGGRSLDGSTAQIQVWDTTKARKLHAIESPNVVALEVAPDGKSFVAAFGKDDFDSWNTRRGRKQKNFKGHDDRVLDLAYSPDGKTVASSSADGTVRLWSAASGKTIGRFDVGADCARIVFSPELGRLAGVTATGTLLVWDLDEEAPLRRVDVAGCAGTAGLDFAPDGESVYVLRNGDTLTRVSAADGATLDETELSKSVTIEKFRVSPDGETVVAFTNTKPPAVWRTDGSGRVDYLLNHSAALADAEFTPDGDQLATFSQNGYARQFVREKDNEFLRITTEHDTLWNRPTALTFTSDGSRLAAGSGSGDVALWDVRRHKLVGRLPALRHSVQGLAHNEDENVLAGYANAGALRLWNLDDESVLGDIEIDDHACSGVGFADGSFLTGWSDGLLRRIAPNTGEIESETSLGGPAITRLVVSDTAGLAAVICRDDTVRLLALSDLSEVARFRAAVTQYWGSPITFDSGGDYLAVRTEQDLIVWNCQSKREVLRDRAAGHVGSLCPLPGSRIAVPVGTAVKAWTLPGGDSSTLYRVNGLASFVLAVSPDGRQAAAGLGDGTLRTFRIR